MVAAVVLAAGLAQRMGRSKVLLPWRGRPLVAHVVAAAWRGGADPVVVVVSPEVAAWGALAPAVPYEVWVNPEPGAGMAASLVVGVRAVAGRARAALVCLGDQPTLRPEAVAALVARADLGVPVVPAYRGVRGHPVLFPASLFPELLRLAGDRGAREVLERHPPAVVPLDLPAPPDVDTPADYEALCAATDGAP
jgi:molybdenum cofactor cytidylyltransferase